MLDEAASRRKPFSLAFQRIKLHLSPNVGVFNRLARLHFMESSLSSNIKNFEQNYQTHLKRLKLNGMQPKTIEAYSLAVRRAGRVFRVSD